MGVLFLVVFLFFLALLHLSPSIAVDTLSPGQSINDTQSLVSAGGSFKLGFFTAGSSNRYLGIWYNTIPDQTVVWVANRQTPVPDSTGLLTIGKDGILRLTNRSGGIHWSTNATESSSDSAARLLDDGNFVVLGNSGSYQWQSFDYPSDTLLPEMKLGWDLRAGLNRELIGWKSVDDPAPGEFSMGMDLHGVPQIFLKDNSDRKWRTGPWNGLRFSGIPEMKGYNMLSFGFKFVANQNEVYYTYNVKNTSIISRLIVNPSGQAQRLVWIDTANAWNPIWLAPRDPCDGVSPCGPYGVCDMNNSPLCSCLQGFRPKSPRDWYLRDGKDGCVRETAVDCRNGTDGFLLVTGAKLPDTSNSTVSMSLDDCRAECLRNCSCTAYAAADISSGVGGGCILWVSDLTDIRVYTTGGQDLYVRLAAADLGSTSNPFHNGRVRIIAAVFAVLGAVVVFGLVGWLIWKKKKGRTVMLGTSPSLNDYQNVESSRGGGGGHGGDLELPLFDFRAMAAATDNFSDENKLGEGGFGPVYMGRLGEEQEVAIKRLARNSVQGTDEFKNEVMLIAKLQHRNLVRLLGCCIQADERMLVYEYMPNKSLDAFLFDKAKGELLDLKTRYQIIVGIARGLLYLHQDSRFRIIHRDLKASNILLDKEMNPKISDFGMARIFGGEETEANTRRVVGTYGYMSPEYAMDGVFSVKSDVFSFGVLVLEIVSGKKNRGFYNSQPQQNLLGHAWSLWNQGNGLELLDASIGYTLLISEALRCINIGLLCVQERPEDRPTMASVVLMLSSDNASLPQPKQPGFVVTRSPLEMYSSSGKRESCSVNNLTVTMFQGR